MRSACPGYPEFAGCVNSRRPRRIYLQPGAARLRGLYYHEVGHVFDLAVLNGRERRAFKRIIGARKGGWIRGNPGPSELFADAYAACSLGRRLSRTAYGYRKTPRRHAHACALMRRAAAPRGRRPQPPPKVPPVVDQKPPPPANQAPPSPTQPKPELCSLLETLLGGC